MPTSNGYADIYSSGSEDEPVFEEMVSNDNFINSINTYYVVPLNTTLASTSNKVLKKQLKTRFMTQLANIK